MKVDCLHLHIHMFIQSPESQNNSFFFFSDPLEMFQAVADFRFRKRHHSQLAKEQKHTRMPFGRTHSLQVISIWCSEWQQEQFPHCLCWMNTEWLVKLQEVEHFTRARRKKPSMCAEAFAMSYSIKKHQAPKFISRKFWSWHSTSESAHLLLWTVKLISRMF